MGHIFRIRDPVTPSNLSTTSRYYAIIEKYVPQTLHRHMLDWYHLYINHHDGSRITEKILELCCCKDLFTQSEIYDKLCKICQKIKNIKTIYVHMPPKNISELKPWDSVHVNLIGPYSKSIIKQHICRYFSKNNFSLACMKMIDPATAWFEIVEVPTFDFNEVTGGNDENIYKSSSKVIQFFNNTRLSRYPRPLKFMFDKNILV